MLSALFPYLHYGSKNRERNSMKFGIVFIFLMTQLYIIHYVFYSYICMHIIVLLCTILYYNIYIVQGYGHVHYILPLFPRMFTSMDFEHGIWNSDIWRIWQLLMSHINYMIQRFPKQQNIAYDWSHGWRLVSLVTTYALV